MLRQLLEYAPSRRVLYPLDLDTFEGATAHYLVDTVHHG